MTMFNSYVKLPEGNIEVSENQPDSPVTHGVTIGSLAPPSLVALSSHISHISHAILWGQTKRKGSPNRRPKLQLANSGHRNKGIGKKIIRHIGQSFRGKFHISLCKIEATPKWFDGKLPQVIHWIITFPMKIALFFWGESWLIHHFCRNQKADAKPLEKEASKNISKPSSWCFLWITHNNTISLYHYITISLYHYITISLYHYITISLYHYIPWFPVNNLNTSPNKYKYPKARVKVARSFDISSRRFTEAWRSEKASVHIWLVVDLPLWKILVSWDDSSQYIYIYAKKNRKCSKPPTRYKTPQIYGPQMSAFLGGV